MQPLIHSNKISLHRPLYPQQRRKSSHPPTAAEPEVEIGPNDLLAWHWQWTIDAPAQCEDQVRARYLASGRRRTALLFREAPDLLSH